MLRTIAAESAIVALVNIFNFLSPRLAKSLIAGSVGLALKATNAKPEGLFHIRLRGAADRGEYRQAAGVSA
jgi:hypothetical protein